MQQSEVKMFADEIARLEAEADEAQKIILTQSERLRTLEQRISALKSVVAGTQTRLSVSVHDETSVSTVGTFHDAGGSETIPAEDGLRSERSSLGTSLFGLQRAYSADSVDVGTYRALSSPFPFVGNRSGTDPAAQSEEPRSDVSGEDAGDNAGSETDRANDLKHRKGIPVRSSQLDERYHIDQRL